MKTLKFFAKCLLALFLASLIFWSVVLGMLQTKQGQKWALDQLLVYIEDAAQMQIHVGKVDFSFPLNLKVEEVRLSQNHHPIASIKKLELSCAFTPLLNGRFVFSQLKATDILIDRLLEQNPIHELQSKPLNAPLLPIYIKFSSVDIQNLRISHEIIERFDLLPEIKMIIENSSSHIQGMLSNNPFRKSLIAHLLITTKQEGSGVPPAIIGIDTKNQQLSLSIHLNQIPLQIFYPKIPSSIKGKLALFASAPIASWQKVSNSTSTNDSIEGHFKFTLEQSLEDRTLLSKLIGQKSSLRGQYHLHPQKEIDLFSLKLKSPHLFLEGEASALLSGKIEKCHFNGELINLEFLEELTREKIQGKIAIDIKGDGFLFSPSLNMNLHSEELKISQVPFQNILSTIQAHLNSQKANGFLTLSFNHQDLPWDGSSFFEWNPGHSLAFSEIHMEALNMHMLGHATSKAHSDFWEGQLEAKINSLSEFSQFLPFPLKGEGDLKFDFDGNKEGKQALRAEVHGKGLAAADLQAAAFSAKLQIDPFDRGSKELQFESYIEGNGVSWKGYSIEKVSAHAQNKILFRANEVVDLSADWVAQTINWPMGKAGEASGVIHLHNPLDEMKGKVEIAFRQIEAETLHLEELVCKTTIDPSEPQWPFSLRGNGSWKEDLLFTIKGGWHYQSDHLEIQMNDLSGRLGPYPLSLLRPVEFHYQPKKMNLLGLHLRWGEAELEADFNQDDRLISAKFKTNKVPSELFHFIAPELPLSGRAAFQGSLEGLVQKPRGQFRVDLHHIQVNEAVFAQKPFISGQVELKLDDKGLDLKSLLNGIGNTPLLVDGHLPAALSLDPFNFKLDPEGPFNLNLNAEGDLDPYLQLFYNDAANLSGQTQIALKLTGPLKAPQIQGTIDLTNGAYESLSTGALYNQIQAHLEGDGSKIILTRFSAHDNKNGSINASGSISLDAISHFPFEFKINPTRIFLVDSDYVAISASGPLSLTGNLKHSKLVGELTVDEALVQLEQALPHSIKHVDVRFINLPDKENQSQVENRESNPSIELDVKLNAPKNVLIQGNHLKSEWKGSLDVTGTPEKLLLHGDLRMANGKYDFNGNIFTLTQGTIHFAGPPGKKTSLYVVAAKDIERIRAEIIVKGAVDKPVISFRSNPPLSQREVLSYILFNRGISDITTDQGDQLSQSFISLNAEQTMGGNDFLSRLRNNIGIDRLDFTTNDKDKEIGLQVGKKITENVTVTYKQSTSISPSIAIEANLGKNIKAQAETGFVDDAPVQMSLKWKKDY